MLANLNCRLTIQFMLDDQSNLSMTWPWASLLRMVWVFRCSLPAWLAGLPALTSLDVSSNANLNVAGVTAFTQLKTLALQVSLTRNLIVAGSNNIPSKLICYTYPFSIQHYQLLQPLTISGFMLCCLVWDVYEGWLEEQCCNVLHCCCCCSTWTWHKHQHLGKPSAKLQHRSYLTSHAFPSHSQHWAYHTTSSHGCLLSYQNSHHYVSWTATRMQSCRCQQVWCIPWWTACQNWRSWTSVAFIKRSKIIGVSLSAQLWSTYQQWLNSWRDENSALGYCWIHNETFLHFQPKQARVYVCVWCSLILLEGRRAEVLL